MNQLWKQVLGFKSKRQQMQRKHWANWVSQCNCVTDSASCPPGSFHWTDVIPATKQCKAVVEKPKANSLSLPNTCMCPT